MQARQRIMIGGLGALTPIVLSLITVDFRVIQANLELGVIIGYAIKVVALFYLGALVAYMHKSEKDTVKLFELGIVAPALIASCLNGVLVPAKPGVGLGTNAGTPSAVFLGVGVAHAQPLTVESRTLRYEQAPQPKPSFAAQLWTGLTGAVSQPLYIRVAVASTQQEADRIVMDLAKKFPNHTYYLFLPSEHNPMITIVVGDGYANKKQAEAQRQKLLSEGFPHGLTYWQPVDRHVRMRAVIPPLR